MRLESIACCRGLLALSGEPYVDPTNGLRHDTPLMAIRRSERGGWTEHTASPLVTGGWVSLLDLSPWPRATRRRLLLLKSVPVLSPAVTGCQLFGLLKFYDDQAQDAYDNFFAVPRAPVAPQVQASALNNEIVLDWGSDSAAIAATEVPAPLGYSFEGQNAYAASKHLRLTGRFKALGDIRFC